ncbi:MAG: protein of unknown function (DUF4157) [Candidatus Nitrotoga sp. SPKER]|nr:MAG: protein of unknown function (DUF4157) [Candidatus Nitrotoga sp. SPKER]
MHTFAPKRNQQPVTSRLVPATKLSVSSPGDLHEQQAERLAAQVTRLPGPLTHRAAGTTPTSGAALPDELRSYFEPRFGHDFSRVRVHTDARAARSAQALGAQAYTLGNDMVLGAGQYAPHTGAGRHLLAHELAHVVQQDNGSVAPMIQRRLLVTGSKKDIHSALSLLKPASGFTLQHDPKTHEVTITASKLKPQSFVLAGQLATIMDDPKQDAEIHLGQDQPAVSFGAFPGNSQALDDNPVQEIRIDQMLALERDAPGAGVAKMAHEIVENYAGHDPKVKQNAWQFAFGEAHSRALDVENAIEGELGHPGARRNTFSVSINPGKGKPPFFREIEDRGSHFLVLDKSSDKGIVSNARRVSRIRVASYTVDGFMVNSNTLPKTAATNVAAIVKDLKKDPTASAFVEGFASLGKTADENTRLADKWAFELRDQVILLANDQTGVSWQRFEIVSQPDKSRNSVVVTIDRPDI